MEEVTQWLLDGEPRVEYGTRIDLLKQSNTENKVVLARKKSLSHPKITGLLTELKDWPGTVLNSHKNASQPFHKLSFIADLGLK